MVTVAEFNRAARRAYPKARHLLSPEWRTLNEKLGEPSIGFCYIAAEAAFHTIGAGFTPRVAAYVEGSMRCTHWWLQQGRRIIDPTKRQYTAFGEIPPYHLGRGTGFLTRKPSRRAKQLLEIMGL